jgi:endonuclease/exonuclease/phosphatase family metal-dependent hydrolase
MMHTARLVAALVGLAVAASAPAQLRVAAWNLSNYSGTDRAAEVRTVVYGQFNGRSLSPDVFALQEFTSASALSTFVGVLNSAPGSPGDWVAAPFITGPDTQSVLVYRTSRAVLVNSVVVALGSTSTTNQPRNTYRYDLRPAGYGPAAGNHFAVYSTHMKAGSTSEDLDRRQVECDRIRNNASGLDTNPTNGVADGLPAGYHFILAGDLNMQSSSQAPYQVLVSAPALGRFFDPINTPGSWNNSSAYRFVHTQDPVGAGGMDDRYDQVLISGGLIDGVGFDYVGNAAVPYSTTTWNDANHSYRAWGNDGTSYNLALTITGNTMVGATIAQALADAAGGAGHLPVYLDLRVPPKAGASAVAIDFGSVPQGSAAPTRTIDVFNAGNTALWNAAGIATLRYTLAASAGFTAPAGTFTDAAGGGTNAHVLSMSTATAGPKSGALTISSDDPDQPTIVVSLTGTVTPPNQPPVANAGPDRVIHDVDGNGSEPVTFDGSGSFDPDGTITNYQWREGAATLADGPSASAAVVLSAGLHTITLTVTDNAGATDDDLVSFFVNRLPTAHAGPDQTLTDSDGSGDEPVTLDALLSADADGTIVLYEWREGAAVLASGPTPTAGVTLSVGGHTITLTVTDDRGGTASDTVEITIEAPMCDPDLNQDGNVDQDDIAYLINVISGGENPTGIDPDFNRDGNVDQDDVSALINVIAGGACP